MPLVAPEPWLPLQSSQELCLQPPGSSSHGFGISMCPLPFPTRLIPQPLARLAASPSGLTRRQFICHLSERFLQPIKGKAVSLRPHHPISVSCPYTYNLSILFLSFCALHHKLTAAISPASRLVLAPGLCPVNMCSIHALIEHESGFLP